MNITDKKVAEINATVAEYIGTEETQCQCEKCQNMCKTAPCLCTPFDVINLIEKGYKDSFIPTVWAAGLQVGLPVIDMVQLKYEHGKCVMFKDGKCSINEHKPLEGRLADCKKSSAEDYNGKTPAVTVAMMWTSPVFNLLINDIFKKII